jgi:type IV pilus assembly protein PilC
MVLQMINVGEETGALDTMLSKVADFYEDEVDTAVDGLTSIIEPLLIVFLGVTVGFLVIAMFMPMFNMGNVVD